MTLVAGPILEDSLRWTTLNRSGFDFDLKIFTGPIPNSTQRCFAVAVVELQAAASTLEPFCGVVAEAELAPSPLSVVLFASSL